jgi:hypothetical protein
MGSGSLIAGWTDIREASSLCFNHGSERVTAWRALLLQIDPYGMEIVIR